MERAGAAAIIAEGGESGGHIGETTTMALLPQVCDAVTIPVLGAGGIADGRGLAAALMLGAAGVLIGTRFSATPEALGHEHVKRALTEAAGGDTGRTRLFDAVRGLDWPAPYTGRAVRNAFTDRWEGREAELRANRVEQDRFRAAVREGDTATAVVWAGEGIDLISSIEPAADIVARIAGDAEQMLRGTARWLTPPRD
jgi:nitronate monooxygenase